MNTSRNPWPWAIGAWFVLAVLAVATFIFWSARQRSDLVSEDYYQEEILYQHRIDARARTEREKLALTYDPERGCLRLSLATPPTAPEIQGEVHFYRPSDARMDIRAPLALSREGAQVIQTRVLQPGRWQVRVRWRTGGAEYYQEQALVIIRQRS